ncbi:hypothetical protein [Bradyrhizobium sp.]|uniref:hypothetical protein n=1 Tax=Bradyrhizobium sp. TaxID=376 RepID=UPI001DDFB659|nr:hypothetical protein [Bradyrhizobium sp.]MBV8696825.1 hypothetical protein [Bradyrhizobium sp.]MBV8919999.1 hypothetical protein [Bradyrhizobium sp.]MBV9980099.1 hypothetical protein [Bradyrhizobium sp.]
MTATIAHVPHCPGMIDSLFARAQVAIDESWALQNRSRALQAERARDRDELRLAVLESAMYRAEMKAYRDNREK